MDEIDHTRVNGDVAYLRDLSSQVLALSTADGRHACQLAATHETGRSILLDLLSANEKWRAAMVSAVSAFDSTNAVIRGALEGEAVGDQPVH
jgi:hypothetical protein